ncbi:non-ribosomal peptide synthetase, partial [Streptomyces griseochromogenes]|uniref:non-ribosomal peptide synthetase n=1 Tax=Streptomyces griseochromogenes TaxID=68214 RepID=UPI00379B0F2D
IETTIANIWSEVLGIDQIGIHDNFFDLGGHSLLATRVVNRVAKVLDSNVSVRDLFQSPTVASMAAGLPAVEGAIAQQLVRRSPATEAPLSFAQRRLWFLDQLEPGSAEYVIPLGLRIAGSLDLAALSTAFSALVARHEVLRTRFVVRGDGEPVQVVDAPWPVEINLLDLSGVADQGRREADARIAVDTEAARSFDLASGPLLRAMAVCLADEEWLLLVTMHHIVADGWSMGVLTRELQALYAEALCGDLASLAELPLQYADFAAWQRDWLPGTTLERQLAYWQEKLTGLEPLELPTDRTRPPTPSSAGGEVSFVVPADIAAELREVARQRNSSLFMVGLAAYQVVLSRWSGQDDISVGSPIAGRNHAEIEDLIGFFVNTLVLRSDLSGNPTFGDFLEQVREATLGAYAHQDLPYEQIVEALMPQRDLTRAPLVQTTFDLQNADEGTWSLGDLVISPLEVTTHTAKFDLSVSLSERKNGELDGRVEYSTELFDRTTVERLTCHLVTTLQRVAADPTVPVGHIDMLSASERHQLVSEWNATAKEFSDRIGIQQLVEAQAAHTPEALALVHGATTMSYTELNSRANQFARYLMDRGVGTGTLVGVCVERGIDLIVALLGVLKAGGVYVPLDPGYPEQRLNFMMRDAQAPFLITQAALRGRFSVLDIEQVVIDEAWPDLSRHGSGNLEPQAGPDDLAYIIYTSGSTGRPKGVMLRHRGLVNLSQHTPAELGMTAESRVLQFSSPSFDASIWEVFTTFSAGATLVLASTNDLQLGEPLELTLQSQEVSMLIVAPTLLSTLSADKLPGLRNLVVGGDSCSLETVNEWAPGRTFINAYGPSEGTVCSTLHLQGENGDRTPIGRPIANTEAYVMDRFGRLAPLGVPGELWIGGSGVARG